MMADENTNAKVIDGEDRVCKCAEDDFVSQMQNQRGMMPPMAPPLFRLELQLFDEEEPVFYTGVQGIILEEGFMLIQYPNGSMEAEPLDEIERWRSELEEPVDEGI
jgi:hypothetical protein